MLWGIRGARAPFNVKVLSLLVLNTVLLIALSQSWLQRKWREFVDLTTCNCRHRGGCSRCGDWCTCPWRRGQRSFAWLHGGGNAVVPVLLKFCWSKHKHQGRIRLCGVIKCAFLGCSSVVRSRREHVWFAYCEIFHQLCEYNLQQPS